MIFKKLPKGFLFIVVLIAILFLPGFVKIQKLLYRNRELQAQIKNLKKENQQLAQEIYKLQHDPVYLEKVAREELRLGKDGEIIYKVVPEKK
jgi:cell division protein FtsL